MSADGGSADTRTADGADDLLHPPLIGRRRELRAAREALRDSGAVLLTGPAGIGLTAVATALATEAAEAGATVLRCTPTRAERSLPYVGLGDLLTCLPPSHLDPLLDGLAGPTGQALRAGLLRGVQPEAGVDRLALGLGLLELLRAIARAPAPAPAPVRASAPALAPVRVSVSAPAPAPAAVTGAGLLLLVDGLPWLDGPSAAALGFALRRAGEGVRLLATARDDGAVGAVGDTAAGGDDAGDDGGDDGGGAGRGRWWEVCQPRTVELRLPPLPPTVVAELLARDLGGPLPVDLLRDVQQVAAGNPRHALDLARAGFRLGLEGPHGVPRNLRAEVLDRLCPLGEAERRLLLLAAVATRPTLAELHAALGSDGGSEDGGEGEESRRLPPGFELLGRLAAPLRLGLLELLDAPRDTADVHGTRPAAAARAVGAAGTDAGQAGLAAGLAVGLTGEAVGSLRTAELRSGELGFREPVVRMVLLEQAAPAELAAARMALAAVVADPVERARLTALAHPTADVISLGAAAREAARDRDAPALAYELALLAVRQGPQIASPAGLPPDTGGLAAAAGNAESCLLMASQAVERPPGWAPCRPAADLAARPPATRTTAVAGTVASTVTTALTTALTAALAADRLAGGRVGHLLAAAEYGAESGHWPQARALALQVLAASEPLRPQPPPQPPQQAAWLSRAHWSSVHPTSQWSRSVDGCSVANLVLRSRARAVLLRAAGQGLVGLGEVIAAGLAELDTAGQAAPQSIAGRVAGQPLAARPVAAAPGLAPLPGRAEQPEPADPPTRGASHPDLHLHPHGVTEAASLGWARSELLRWSAERQLLAGGAPRACGAARAALAAARAVSPSAAGSAAEQQVGALWVFALALAGCGELAGARHALDEATALLRNVEPRAARRELRHRLLDAELSVDRPAHLRTALAALPAEATAGSALPGALIPSCAAYAQLGDGPSAMAAAVQLQEALAAQGEPLAGPSGVGAGAPTPTHGLALHVVALAELVGGSAERAGELARRAAAGWGVLGDRWHQVRALGALGESGLLRGKPAATAAGVEALQEAQRLSVAAGFADPPAVRRLALLAEGLVALGEHVAAAQVLGQGEELIGRWDIADAPARAALDRAAGLARAGIGNGREAVALLRAAAERQRVAGLPLEVARTLVALGSVERRLRHRPGARAALLEAREICTDHHALPLLARVERESDRVDQAIALPGADSGLLTASEQRMAGLAAEGATNREVAAALFVSVKTVEGTLSRVYRKLGVRSRAALARALAGTG